LTEATSLPEDEVPPLRRVEAAAYVRRKFNHLVRGVLPHAPRVDWRRALLPESRKIPVVFAGGFGRLGFGKDRPEGQVHL